MAAPGSDPRDAEPRATPPTGRLRGFLAGAGGLSLAAYLLGVPQVAGRGAHTFPAYVVLYAALFGLYIVAVVAVARRPTADRIVLATILGFALLFRLAMLPTPVFLSSDPYRYLWDGRVQRSGVNPYRHTPADPALRPLRDPVIHPQINRPTQPTVYPPGAEVLFALVAAVAPDSLLAWRLFVLAAEIATGALLLRLLRRMRVAASAVLVYAWAPLVVFEGVQAGHVDVVMLPFLLLALGWRQAGRLGRAGVALGLAIVVKLYPAVLLPVWWRRRDVWLAAACGAVIVVAYALYLPRVGPRVMGFLPRYFTSAEDFNIGLRLFLTDAIALIIGHPGLAALGGLVIRGMRAIGYLDAQASLDRLVSAEEAAALRQAMLAPSGDIGELLQLQVGRETLRALAMTALFAVLAAVLFRIGRRRTPGPAGVFRAGMAAVAAYLVLVPTALHPWYAVWILPFLAVSPSAAWLWFTGTVPLSYLKYAWEPAGLPLWVRLVEFLPLYGLLALYGHAPITELEARAAGPLRDSPSPGDGQ